MCAQESRANMNQAGAALSAYNGSKRRWIYSASLAGLPSLAD
jgi:hypothetical protein